MSPRRILLVEDEPSIADTLVYALRTEGFEHLWVSTMGEARKALSETLYDLIILDVGLPDGNGFDLCRELRSQLQTPVLFLTARQAEIDRIVGLEIGGDDYVTKPFSPREITARIRAILRRTGHSGVPVGAYPLSGYSPAVESGVARESKPACAWTHDTERKRIIYFGHALELTRNEYKLLTVLLKRPGRIFSRDELLYAAWDDPEASGDRTVDAHVKLLRAKLRAAVPEQEPIETHRGLGYSMKDGLK